MIRIATLVMGGMFIGVLIPAAVFVVATQFFDLPEGFVG